MKAYEIDWTEPKTEHAVNWSYGEHAVNWTKCEIDWTEPKTEHAVNW